MRDSYHSSSLPICLPLLPTLSALQTLSNTRKIAALDIDGASPNYEQTFPAKAKHRTGKRYPV